jgi:hypothetical protein
MKRVFFLFTALLLMVPFLFFAQEPQPTQPANDKQQQAKETPPPQVSPAKKTQLGRPERPDRIKVAPAGESAPAAEAKPENAGPPPKLEVPEIEFNAGDVVKGDVIEHDFIFNNKGEGKLQIIRVQPTCGCTVTKYDQEVEPGKSGKVTASVKTENFTGDIAKTINVQTNDKDMQALTLTIKAHIKTLLSVKPSERLTLGLIYVGQALEKEFDIVSEDGQTFDITQVTTADDKTRYNVTSAPDKKSAKFVVTIPADYPVGPVNANFTLKTTHPKVENLNINLFGTMREPLSVFPVTVTYNGLSKDFIEKNPESPELNKVVTVRLETEPSLEVKEVKSSLAFVQTTFENTQPNQAYSVKIHLDPKKVKVGPFEGTVLVYTNKKTITIPVRGVIF